MYNPIALLFLFGLCASAAPNNTNDVIEDNNKILNFIDKIYQNIVLWSDHHNQDLRRQFSIFSAAVAEVSNKPDSESVFTVANAVLVLAKDNSDDVVVGNFKRNLDLLVAYLDQPINNIKRACPPGTEQLSCIAALTKYTDISNKLCKKFENHLHLYELVKHLVKNTDSHKLMQELLDRITHYSDEATLTLFTVSIIKYKSVFDGLKDINNALKNSTGPCTFL